MTNIFKQNHPKGLYLLFCVEMWERFSFYGMRALIVLYMVQELMYSAQKAGNIYGFYTGFVYLTPLLGGYIADRFLGQRRCITTGAVLMSIGLFLLAFGGEYLFLFSLFLMIAANGFFKSNISSVLGLLYRDNTEKKDAAYTIFYMGINLGAFFSPLICGTLAMNFGFKWGFASAGIGMLIGLSLYKIFENKLLGTHGLYPSIARSSDKINEKDENCDKLPALIALMLFTIPFWVCFEQAGSSLTLFAEYNVNRIIFGHEIPTEYFQSLNPLFIITLAPLVSAMWETLRAKSIEPSSVNKFNMALFIISSAFLIMTCAGYMSKSGQVSPLWLVAAYFIMTIAELCLSPIGLSLVSKLAPRKFLSLMMGCWFLTSFCGNLIAGIWGGRFETISTVELFGTLAILSFVTGILLSVFKKYICKTLN